MKKNEQVLALCKKVMCHLTEILQPEKLMVPEMDTIMDALFCNFMVNSISSIPENLRKAYLQHRLMNISGIIDDYLESNNIKIEFEDYKNGTHEKETMH